MQIEITRKFQKQIESCNGKHVINKILAIIQAVIASENLIEFPNLKKLSGYKNYYRIRLGNYRIGLVLEDKTVVFAAFDHRSEIYKYFP
jgi:mRNA interferase RelE/StbE